LGISRLLCVKNDNKTLSLDSGNTLYVGGSGEGNYTSIQEAINDSLDGDTIFVYDDSSPYVENLIMNKSIFLIGEDKSTTEIDGCYNYKLAVVKIMVDNVSIQGFTIKGGNEWWDYNYYGFQILSNYNNIIGNIIRNNNAGIQLGSEVEVCSNNNIIKRNIIENTGMGIVLDGSSSNNTIFHNIISSNDYHGIFLRYGECINNIISYNEISNNGQIGIWLSVAKNYNIIQHNSIINNRNGVFIINSHNNKVLENNIYDNKNEISILGDFWDFIKGDSIKDNIFNANYWGRSRFLPVVLIGFYGFLNSIPLIPLVIFDMNPAQKPYDIRI